MPVSLTGSCRCGAVKFSCESHTPQPYQRCYCSICRKTAGGGGYAINLAADTRTLKIADPSVVVWDEFVGQWIALAPLLLWPRNAGWIACGFILFRLFDIAKPWPVSWADRAVKGGLGVMLDDAIAGALAALVLVLLLVGAGAGG